MKTITILGVALASLGLAAQASAATTYELSPKSTSFTGTGSTQLTKGSLVVPCTAHFVGKTSSAGVGSITGATFTGNVLCSGVKATGLPWTGKALSATGGTIYDASVSASIFGTCGPTNVPVTISKTGVITFSSVTLKPNCVVKGSIQTKPAVTIVK